MADMKALLAKLREKTANPAGDNPQDNPSMALAVQTSREPETLKLVKPARTLESKLGFEFLEKINKLEDMLLERHPLMPNLLREIHKALAVQPENVILANEEELAIIVSGLDRQTGEELASLTVSQSKKPAGKAKAAKISSNMLGFD